MAGGQILGCRDGQTVLQSRIDQREAQARRLERQMGRFQRSGGSGCRGGRGCRGRTGRCRGCTGWGGFLATIRCYRRDFNGILDVLGTAAAKQCQRACSKDNQGNGNHPPPGRPAVRIFLRRRSVRNGGCRGRWRYWRRGRNRWFRRCGGGFLHWRRRIGRGLRGWRCRWTRRLRRRGDRRRHGSRWRRPWRRRCSRSRGRAWPGCGGGCRGGRSRGWRRRHDDRRRRRAARLHYRVLRVHWTLVARRCRRRRLRQAPGAAALRRLRMRRNGGQEQRHRNDARRNDVVAPHDLPDFALCRVNSALMLIPRLARARRGVVCLRRGWSCRSCTCIDAIVKAWPEP